MKISIVLEGLVNLTLFETNISFVSTLDKGFFSLFETI